MFAHLTISPKTAPALAAIADGVVHAWHGALTVSTWALAERAYPFTSGLEGVTVR